MSYAQFQINVFHFLQINIKKRCSPLIHSSGPFILLKVESIFEGWLKVQRLYFSHFLPGKVKKRLKRKRKLMIKFKSDILSFKNWMFKIILGCAISFFKLIYSLKQNNRTRQSWKWFPSLNMIILQSFLSLCL